MFRRKKEAKEQSEEEQIQELVENIIVNALARAMERKPIWWQWLMLIVVGILAGMGLGAFLQLQFGYHPTCLTVQVVYPNP